MVRVSTSLVTVPVTVTDRDGRYVTDLARADFHVFEDGVEQEIAFFEPVEKSLTIALLLDVSDSTKFRIKDVQAAAIAFLDQLRPEDSVIVVAFDKRVQLLAEATNDRAKLVEAIGRLQPGTGTSVFNALDMVIRQRLNSIRGRKAIVLFSDGVDTASAGATYDSNVDTVEEFGGAVYTVRFNTFDSATRTAAAEGGIVASSHLSRHSAYELGTTYLYELAYRTGARAQRRHGRCAEGRFREDRGRVAPTVCGQLLPGAPSRPRTTAKDKSPR
ncbi:MAG: Ca-activated chloride channel [Acidobacteriota bacterium]|nr:Ca-activated chloride channel [Acidobacteriota bacterium]